MGNDGLVVVECSVGVREECVVSTLRVREECVVTTRGVRKKYVLL